MGQTVCNSAQTKVVTVLAGELAHPHPEDALPWRLQSDANTVDNEATHSAKPAG
jgi:hypothetical protein